MSSWIGDWERNLIPRSRKSGEANYRTQCKLGGEILMKDTPATWLKDPMGLSCLEHVQEKAQEDWPLPAAELEDAERLGLVAS